LQNLRIAGVGYRLERALTAEWLAKGVVKQLRTLCTTFNFPVWAGCTNSA